MHLVLFPILGLFTIRFNGYGIREVKKNNFPTDRPIPEKQGRVRGNKNILKVGLRQNNENKLYLYIDFEF